MGKLKYTVLGLITMCLTAGGVFAAWKFSENSLNLPEDIDVNLSTEELGGLEFDYVSVKFDANGGVFAGGDTEKSIFSKK